MRYASRQPGAASSGHGSYTVTRSVLDHIQVGAWISPHEESVAFGKMHLLEGRGAGFEVIDCEPALH